jgi:hypothetical protein
MSKIRFNPLERFTKTKRAVMKSFIYKHGRPVGGLFGIATAVTMYLGYKPVGLILSFIAIALVITAEHKKRKTRQR